MSKVYYKDDRVMLIQGDCLEVMPKLKQTFDMCLTDPPYGTTACKWDNVIPFEPMWDNIKRLVKKNGAIALFGGEPFSSALRISNIKMFKYDWVYQKSQKQNFLNAKKQPLRNHEICSVFYSSQCLYNPQMTTGKPYTCKSGKSSHSISADSSITNGGHLTVNEGDRYPVTITKSYSQEVGYHPTQKPVPLLEYLIKTYTSENELVLDFTCGSGSTLIAGLETGRRVVGIEMDEKYCEVAKQRILKWYEEHKNDVL